MPKPLTVAFFLGAALLVLACGDRAGGTADRGAAAARFPARSLEGDWRAWGGPNGNFQVRGADLADSWPAGGPPQLWSRVLGPGYSAVSTDGRALFTMYRDGVDDVVIALRADDGDAVWTYRYPAPTREGNTTQFGKGPHATPLVLDDRVITLGFTGILSCLVLDTGELLWSHDLVEDFGGDVLDFGNSASPIRYRDWVVVLVGGQAQGAMALDPADGSVVWRSSPSTVSYATPIVIEVDGQEQIVYFSADEIIGLEAATGTRQWSHSCVNEYRNNATGPIWGEDQLLWVSTQLDGGTRVLRLTGKGGSTDVEELWFDHKISIHFWNALRLGDHVYASIGSKASVLAAIDVQSGEVKWRQRGYKQVNLVQAGDRTLLFGADGRLVLARLTPGGVTVLAETNLLEGDTWTAPTLVGTTLFVRDKQSIRAVDLSAAAAAMGEKQA